MKHALLMLGAVAVLAAIGGCSVPCGQCGTGLIRGSCTDCPENCAACDACGYGECATACGGGCNMYIDPACQGGPCRGRGGMAHGRGCGPCCGDPPFDPGPAGGAITYPYYTTRGPRDFLASSPRSLGP